VLGWREFIRGVYWLAMPGLREANHYRHLRPLPGWYWTATRGWTACGRSSGRYCATVMRTISSA